MTTTVREFPSASPPAARLAVLGVCVLAGVISILKGVSTDIVNGADYYWLLRYDHGFVRRGLIGAMFHAATAPAPFESLKPLIVGLHVTCCCGVIALLSALFARVMARESASPAALALLLLMAGPLLPSLAYLTGYLDVYIILILLAAFWLVVAQRYFAAALLACLGPCIHESFIFLWASVAILVAWSCVTTRSRVMPKLVAAAAPALTALTVVTLHSPRATVLAIQAMPLPEEIRDSAIMQMGFTLGQSFSHMWQYEYPGHGQNLTISFAYFVLPSLMILCTAGVMGWPRWQPHRAATALAAVAATLAPLTILAVAWDLSRFLVWSNVSASLTLIAAVSPGLLAPPHAASHD